MTREDDAAHVARCLRGDSEAFEPLVRKYQRPLFTAALRLLGNREDARDATQNAFVRAYARLETYDPRRRFFSWIYRIGVNESLNFRRTQHPHEPLPAGLAAAGAPRDGVEAKELTERVQAALLELSGEYREVIVLRYFTELSYEEIADALGIPEKTVKSRLFSARQRLAVILAARGEHGG